MMGSRRGSTSPTGVQGMKEVDQFLLEEAAVLSDSEDDAYTLVAGSKEGSKAGSGPPSAILLIEDPGDFARKLRAGTVYMFTSTAYQLLLFKLSARTAWSTTLSLLPGEAVVGSLLGVGLNVIARKRGDPISIFDKHATWRPVLLLASIVFLASLTNVLQAAMVQPALSSALQTYAAPLTLLLLPVLGLVGHIPSNGFLLLAALCIPLAYGLALADLDLTVTAMSMTLASVAAEAAKLTFAKAWFVKSERTAFRTTLSLYPLLAAISCLVILPILGMQSGFSSYPRYWPWFAIFMVVFGICNTFAGMTAVASFDSPASMSLLSVPRGVLVTLLHGGIAYGHEGATCEIMVVSVLSIVALGLLIYKTRRNVGTRHPHLDLDIHDAASPSSTLHLSLRATKSLAIISLFPLICWLAAKGITPQLNLSARIDLLRSYTAHTETVDIVIATYNEPAENVRKHIVAMKYYWWIKQRDPRVILYMKGNISDAEEYRKATGADIAIRLPNKGREAGTFLKHILLNYNASVDPTQAHQYRAGLADHTLFMQHHLAWDWIARERMWLFRPNTGYLHFAPYIKLDCGKDMDGNGDFPRIAQIYSMFKEDLCPPTLQLGAYAAQFVVSKKRILANTYKKYRALDDIIEAEGDHWIHREGTWWHYHGDPGPTNPFFGHAMERSWPIIFGCSDPSIKDTCDNDQNVEGCQCFD